MYAGLAFCVVLLVISSGCASPDVATNDPATAASVERRTNSSPPPPAEWDSLGAFNGSSEYPRAGGSGRNEEFMFDVPAETRTLTIQWTAELVCPSGYRSDASFALTTPNDEVLPFDVFSGVGIGPTPYATYTCTAFPPPTSTKLEPKTSDLPPLAGEWKLTTFGECTCEAFFAVMAEVPRR